MKKFIRAFTLVLALLCTLSLFACKDESAETEQSSEDARYYVEYNGTRIELGAKADAIIKALGEPQDKKEIGDCGGLGAQVKYSYSSFEVYVLESKTNGNIIDQITLRDDLVSTPEGVCIGQSADAVEKAMGEAASKTDSAIKYENAKYAINIGIKNGAVASIDYITK